MNKMTRLGISPTLIKEKPMKVKKWVDPKPVIPAKAGIHRRASARRMTRELPKAAQVGVFVDSCARYRLRWIPAFAGMTDGELGRYKNS